jgi:hypothetical protein
MPRITQRSVNCSAECAAVWERKRYLARWGKGTRQDR